MHMDLDSFFVSVERRKNPALEGKPVLVGGGNRGVVASCSYEARAYGVHSAMPMQRARQLCPEAVVVPGDHEQYSMYSKMVTEIIAGQVPVYEKSSIDEFYIDLTGMDRFFGCYKLASELRQKIMRETRLPISFGLSTGKTVAKMATNEAKPNGQLQVCAGTEKAFLAPLSVSKIPMVGEKTFQALKAIGVETIRTVQEMPVETLQKALGDNGVSIWKKANGIDHSPVEPYNERKTISTECTFEKDTTDVAHLTRVLISMTEKLTFQLRAEEKLTACVTVKIRYRDFNTYTMQARIAYTAFDHSLIEKVKELFGRLFDQRQAIRLIGVKFSHLIQGTYQYNLFDNTGEQVELYKAMDKLRQRFGGDAVMRAASVGLEKRGGSPFLRD